jgi:CRP/FNR family transcriptional regulator, cyclic AMP receptor protein
MSLVSNNRRLLDALAADDLSALFALGVQRRAEPGDRIMHEGEESRFVIFITSGWVTVSTSTLRGGELILAIRGPGDVLGDLSALDGRPRSATVTALDGAGLVVITGDRFEEYLLQHPGAAIAYMRELGARLRDADSERRALVSATVLQRLARLLLDLADRQGGMSQEGRTIRPALAQHQLAASIGATREAVAKALRVLRERDVVRTGPRHLVIVHWELLDLLAASALDAG